MTPNLPRLEFRVSLISRILFSVIAVLCVAHLVSHFVFDAVGESKYTEQLVEWFGLDGEGNFPALFSALILLISSSQFALVAGLSRHSSGPARDDSRYWSMLSMIFLFLALDEAVQIHEMFDSQSLLSFMNTTGLLAWPWVIVYGLLVFLFVAFFFRFWLRIPTPYQWMYFVSATVYVGAALGGEMLGAWEYTEGGGKRSMLYFAIYTCEELMEMLAIVLLIHTNNLQLANEYPPAILAFISHTDRETGQWLESPIAIQTASSSRRRSETQDTVSAVSVSEV